MAYSFRTKLTFLFSHQNPKVRLSRLIWLPLLVKMKSWHQRKCRWYANIINHGNIIASVELSNYSLCTWRDKICSLGINILKPWRRACANNNICGKSRERFMYFGCWLHVSMRSTLPCKTGVCFGKHVQVVCFKQLFCSLLFMLFHCWKHIPVLFCFLLLFSLKWKTKSYLLKWTV